MKRNKRKTRRTRRGVRIAKKTRVIISATLSILILGCACNYVFQGTEAANYPREDQYTSNAPHVYGQHTLHERYLSKEHDKKIDDHKHVTHKAKHLDLERLHQIGNKHCRGANRDYGYTKYPKKNGNYWSFYKTHHVPMYYKKHTYIGINRKVLKKHGVDSGINFNTSLNNNQTSGGASSTNDKNQA